MTKLHKRQLRRVRDFIRRAEKRGYQFDTVLKQSLKSDTLSTQKLKTLTPSKLYSQAKFSLYGSEISGIQARAIERSLSAKKGAETRRRKAEEIRDRYYDYSDRDYADYDDTTSYEDKILSEVEDLIATYYFSSTMRLAYNAKALDIVLKEEIARYGRRRVAITMENAPDDIKAKTETVIYASTDEKLRNAITDFQMLITGEIPTIEDSINVNEAYANLDPGYEDTEI